MISFNEFKEKVMFGYMAYEDKLYVTMYFDKFSKYLEVRLNAFVCPGQRINMPSEKLKESISDKIYYWYEELKEELEKLYPEQITTNENKNKNENEMIQLEFNF